jgi:nicotinamidase-related amidase
MNSAERGDFVYSAWARAGVDGHLADVTPRRRVSCEAHLPQQLRGIGSSGAPGGYPSGVTATAVLVIDMLNTYDHPDADALAANVAKVIDPMAQLISAARKEDDVEVIYINDNRGDFSAGREELVKSALNGVRPELVEPIVPDADFAFLTKVRHSAFYATPLDYLLGRLETTRIVLAGQVTEQCILYSALDGYIRHLEVVVPPDAVASIIPELGEAALKMMQRNMGAGLLSVDKCL